MLISFFYTPLLLSFLGTEQYGVWATMMSVLNWLTIFDLGIGGGFRNLLSKKVIDNTKIEIKRVISTAYVLVSIVSITILIIGTVVSIFVNWHKVFNTDVDVQLAVFLILIFICLNFVFGLTGGILYAIQKAEYVSFIGLLIQITNFTGIFVIKNIGHPLNNGITMMASLYLIGGVFVNIFCLVFIWCKNSNYIPSINFFKKDYVHEIFSFGTKLFFVQIAAMILFATDNMIITQLYNPAQVSVYNITYVLFNVIYSIFYAVLTPMWSRYTMEQERKNFLWIKKAIQYQLILWIVFVFGVALFCMLFIPISHIWLHKDLNFPNSLILTMGVYTCINMFTGIFAIFLNGTGNINIELLLGVLGAIINIPLSIFLAKHVGFGLSGVCMATIICQLPGVIIYPMWVYRYLKVRVSNLD